jgi:hypothetical protein
MATTSYRKELFRWVVLVNDGSRKEVVMVEGKRFRKRLWEGSRW